MKVKVQIIKILKFNHIIGIDLNFVFMRKFKDDH